MHIGKLRDRITLEYFEEARDSFGAQIKVWAPYATLWAQIQPVSGKEYFASQAVHAQVSTKIMIRYLEGVTPLMRVSYADRYFEIISVIDEDERHITLTLMCQERVEYGQTI